MRTFFELEINGKVVATRYRYDSIKQMGELSGKAYKIFTYRKSNFNKIGKFVTKDEIHEVAEMRRNGMKWEDIANHLGWNKKTLQFRLKKVYGTVISKNGKLTDDKKQEAVKMLMDGVKRYQIAEELGVSMTTIYRLFNNEEFMGEACRSSPMGIAKEVLP